MCVQRPMALPALPNTLMPAALCCKPSSPTRCSWRSSCLPAAASGARSRKSPAPAGKQLLRRYENFLQYALPLYVKEGKSQLTIAVGCTGGKHRSITFARKLAEYCTSLGYEPGVQHRDAVR